MAVRKWGTVEARELVRIAIEKEAELSNEQLAIRQANKVEGLEIGEDGEVESVDLEKSEALRRLIENFEEMMGEVAANLIAEEMKSKEVEASDLPEELSRRY